nr:hypothetical protein B0A51_05207 [Rachicladosporium sp. CCFEE 5018]
MAEALVVLGVAAASAQFLQLGVEALRICKEIRDNGATDGNTQLERYIKESKDIQKILPSTPSSTAGGRRINEVGIKCSGTGNELLAVLQHVKGAASGKASVFRVSMRAMRSRKTIEKLANALKDYQRLLDLALSADMRVKVQQLPDNAVNRHADTTDRLAQMATSATAQNVQTRSDIGSLHTDIRAGIKQTVDAAASKHAETIDRLLEMATSSAAQHGQTRSQVTIAHGETIDQLSQLQLRVTGEHDRLQHDMDEATTAVRGDLASANEIRQRESFLKSLHFEDMERREASIKSALARTYDWIFDKSYDQQRTSGQALSRVTLRQWLHSNQSTYWVSGKAGSGKSTLMAFINGDRRLDEALESWAGNQAYIKVGSFFWRAGSWLQTHITGLLRSILHQLCRARSRVVDKLASFYGNPPVWTEGNLLGAIRRALRLLHNVRVFMVIDGLDELEGDYDQLLEVMGVLASGTMRKMCIASRPETILAHRLSSLPGLRLEDLNLEDIHRVATIAPVTTDKTPESLVDFVAQCAQAKKHVLARSETCSTESRELHLGRQAADFHEHVQDTADGALDRLRDVLIRYHDGKLANEAYATRTLPGEDWLSLEKVYAFK